MIDDWLDRGLLGRTRRIIGDHPAHAVGGAVRDHLLDRAPYDVDLVLDGTAEQVALILESQLPARLVRLGARRFAALRLVSEDGVVDLWDREGATLARELARRDLTVNSIAVDLRDGAFVDPMGGRADLEIGLLRANTDRSFVDDPLRVLRLARFATTLPGFTIDPKTLELARQASPRLPAIAAERRREELARALEAQSPEAAIETLAALGIYPAIVRGRADGAERAVGACRCARTLRRELGLESADAAVSLSVLHGSILVTAAEGELDALLEDGWVTRSQAREIAIVTEVSALPSDYGDQRWWLHRTGGLWPTALCHAAALACVSRPFSSETAEISVSGCQRDRDRAAAMVRIAQSGGRELFTPEPLLRGGEVGDLLEIEAGPDLGVAVRRLRRRQIEGKITSRREAIEWLLSERRSSGAD